MNRRETEREKRLETLISYRIFQVNVDQKQRPDSTMVEVVADSTPEVRLNDA